MTKSLLISIRLALFPFVAGAMQEDASEVNIAVLQHKFYKHTGIEFSVHAVERMAERKVSSHDIHNAIIGGKSKKGKNGKLEIYFRDLKVITNQQKNLVITVYFKDELHNKVLKKLSKQGRTGGHLEIARDKEVVKQRENKIRNARDEKNQRRIR